MDRHGPRRDRRIRRRPWHLRALRVESGQSASVTKPLSDWEPMEIIRSPHISFMFFVLAALAMAVAWTDPAAAQDAAWKTCIADRRALIAQARL
jgi:hypothetical protein